MTKYPKFQFYGCCVAHTGLVAIYDVSSTALTRVWSVPGDPEARVTGIDTCHESDNYPQSLVTCSSDGCVRVWDTRQAGTQPTLVMRDTSEHRGPPGVSGHKPLSCVATRPGDQALVVAGTEQVHAVGMQFYVLPPSHTHPAPCRRRFDRSSEP